MAFALLNDGDMASVHTQIVEWLHLIRGEYLESPGLALSRAEIQRMWRLDDTTCDALLDALVQTQFLRLARNKRYVRAGRGTEGSWHQNRNFLT